MKTLSFLWTEHLREVINQASRDPYPIECHERTEMCDAIKAAVNQGIDSHLEAVFFTEFPGDYGKRGFLFDPRSMAVLVRRLMESGSDEAQSLASGICETLGIELI